MIDNSERYQRNHIAISEEEQKILAQKKVIILGGGGLGGYIIELMGRLGVGRITAVDGDTFAPSNLNRQLNSSAASLGRPKAVVAKERMAAVNDNVEFIAVQEFFTEENADSLLEGQDLIIDALDNPKSRMVMARAAQRHGLTIVSGSIAGWQGRITVVEPGSKVADFLWGGTVAKNSLGNLGFTAACAASMECAEATKVLLGRADVLKGRMLEFNLLHGSFYEIPLDFD